MYIWPQMNTLEYVSRLKLVKKSPHPTHPGGTHCVRVMGRLRGIDPPPFFKELGKILISDPPFYDFKEKGQF